MTGKNNDCPRSQICNIVRLNDVAAEHSLAAAVRASLEGDLFDPRRAEAAENHIARTKHFSDSYKKNLELMPDVAMRCGACVVGQATVAENNWETNFY